MGGMLSQPVTDKRSNEGKGLGLSYGLSSMQGWRTEMEDAHDVKIGLKYGLEDWSYFAVFDGHAGKRAAAFAAWNLLEFILRDTQFKLDTENLPEYVCIEPDLNKLNDVIREETGDSTKTLPECEQQSNRVKVTEGPESSNQNISSSDQTASAGESNRSQSSTTTQDNKTSQSSSPPRSHSTSSPETDPTKQDNQSKDGVNQSDKLVPNLSKFAKLPVMEQLDLVESAIKSGFLRIDQSMRDSSRDMSGCTAVCALISPTHLFIANCGDSRAVLYGGESQVKFATEDHKPLNPKERRRIINAGGSATQRINGTLAVSRALGDFEFKKDALRGPCEQLVSPEPEVTVIERHPDDQFLVLACDGIWDVMDNELLCWFIAYKLKVEPSLKNVCNSVLDLCLHKGSRDNMSIIIVVFENGPKFSEIERQRDLKNDEHIAEVVRTFGEKQDDFNEFFFNLKEYRFCDIRKRLEDMGGYLPPGGNLEAKFDMIHDIFEKEFEEKLDSKTDDDQ
uniref:Protein phosphatase 1B n=1 Tax=Aceria tosichella TaxID=561515 RepID=A0A6G1SJC8_9ACAR